MFPFVLTLFFLFLVLEFVLCVSLSQIEIVFAVILSLNIELLWNYNAFCEFERFHLLD